MAATYPGGVDPISIARRAAEDTVVGGSERFLDDRYYGWLLGAIGTERLEVYMPTNNTPGNLTASAKVFMNSGQLELVLKSSVSNASGETIVIAPKDKPYYVGELVDDILDLGHGWEVGLRGGVQDTEWNTESSWSGSSEWRDSIMDHGTLSLATLARAAVLAITGVNGVGADVDAFGDYKKNSAKLRFQRYASVRVEALRAIVAQGAGRTVISRKEGNVSRRFASPGDALTDARSAAQDGIYAAVP